MRDQRESQGRYFERKKTETLNRKRKIMEETNGKMTSGKKKWGTLILMAVMFGLIAGGIMYDVNAVGSRIRQKAREQG